MSNEIILIYITADTNDRANYISNHLLGKKLIACSNIFPINSIFNFEGNVCKEMEHVIICKTLVNMAENVTNEVERIHNYTIPCIIQIPAKINEMYFLWMKQQVLV